MPCSVVVEYYTSKMEASPFDRKAFHKFIKSTKNHRDTDSKWLDTVKAQFHNKFIQGLHGLSPVVGHINRKFRLPLGVLYLVVLIGIFLALFFSGYRKTRETTFLAPLDEDEEADVNCESIPASNSGYFGASFNGIWDGGSGFEPSSALYLLKASNLKISKKRYKDTMRDIYLELQDVGSIAESQDLASNLLTFVTKSFSFGSPEQRLYMAGDPVSILKRQHTRVSFASEAGVCTLPIAVSVETFTGDVSASFNHADLVSDPVCSAAIDPVLFGYDTFTHPVTQSIGFDMRSAMVAMAINAGIVKLTELSHMENFVLPESIDTGTYTVRSFLDPRFPASDPIPCLLAPLDNTTDPTTFQVADDYSNVYPLCALYFGANTAVPMFHHMGQDFNSPVPCDCDSLSEAATQNPLDNCNRFYFISGFMFFKDADFLQMAHIFYDADSYKSVVSNAYNASFIASVFGQQSSSAAALNSNDSLSSAFDFCRIGDVSCSIIAISHYDTGFSGWDSTFFGYQVPTGACNDFFTISSDNWDSLVETPFAQLEYPYQECRKSRMRAVMEQAGISFGNLQILIPLCVLLMLLLARVVRSYLGVPEEYPKHQRDEALDELAGILLTERDKMFHRFDRAEELNEFQGPDQQLQSDRSTTGCRSGFSGKINEDRERNYHYDMCEVEAGSKSAASLSMSDRLPNSRYSASIDDNFSASALSTDTYSLKRHRVCAALVEELVTEFEENNYDIAQHIHSSVSRTLRTIRSKSKSRNKSKTSRRIKPVVKTIKSNKNPPPIICTENSQIDPLYEGESDAAGGVLYDGKKGDEKNCGRTDVIANTNVVEGSSTVVAINISRVTTGAADATGASGASASGASANDASANDASASGDHGVGPGVGQVNGGLSGGYSSSLIYPAEVMDAVATDAGATDATDTAYIGGAENSPVDADIDTYGPPDT